MTETSSVWLWLLQIAWWLAITLPLAAAGVLIVLVLRELHRRARAIEQKPIEPGPAGFVKLLRDKFTHQTLGQSMLMAIGVGLAAGGMVGLLLQAFIQRGVQNSFEPPVLPVPAAPPAGNEDFSLELISLMALLAGAMTLGLGVYTYRSLRRRAAGIASTLQDHAARRPLLVRWFHDSRIIGIVALMLGGYVCFGLLMQVANLVLLIVPWPAALTSLSARWATNAITGIVVAAGVVALLAPAALAVWMGWRQQKLEIRYYRENRIFRRYVNVTSAVGAGFFGALIFMNLLVRLEIVPESDWFSQVVVGLWVAAYLLAYAAAILGQVKFRRWQGRRFNLWNIALAMLVAAPGSIPVAYILVILLARFVSGIFPQG